MNKIVSKAGLANVLDVISFGLFVVAAAMFIARLMYKTFASDDVITVLIASFVLQRLANWLKRPAKKPET